MKVSIWQQFSSNHSASFAIVGHFRSATDAHEVADQLREWMTRIFWQGGNRGILTTTEKEISSTYEIDWYKNGLDWNGIPENIDHVVQQIQNAVFLMCPLETYDDHQPFVDLINKMGAYQIISFEGANLYQIVIELTCKAPDETTAVHFEEHTQEQLEKPFPGRKHLWSSSERVYGAARVVEGAVQRNGSNLEMRFEFFRALDVCRLLHFLENNGYAEIQYRLTNA